MKAKPNRERMDELAERIRGIGGDPRVTEKYMFGCQTFLLDGHVLVGAMKDGGALLSVGKAHFDEALQHPGTQPMTMGSKQMTGFVLVGPDALEDDETLQDWLERAERWSTESVPD